MPSSSSSSLLMIEEEAKGCRLGLRESMEWLLELLIIFSPSMRLDNSSVDMISKIFSDDDNDDTGNSAIISSSLVGGLLVYRYTPSPINPNCGLAINTSSFESISGIQPVKTSSIVYSRP
ncbi:hypothetical protein TWF751_012112 [Orbilia oligospora]|nr:hypothetical protein TWF751_012112 [Orbilia oligospora]